MGILLIRQKEAWREVGGKMQGIRALSSYNKYGLIAVNISNTLAT